MTFDTSLLDEPDAVLLRQENDAAILEALTYYTVPIMFFRAGADRENLLPQDYEGNGSGVLFHLSGYHFILSAGHCVEDYQKQPCAFGVDNGPHCYAPPRWHSGYRYTGVGERDFGYILIPEDQVGRFTSGNRVFLSRDRVEPLSSAETRTHNDWMILAGYPSAIQQKASNGLGARLLSYPTTLAGLGNAPASELNSPAQAVEYVDLWVPQMGVQPASDYAEVEVPLLGGASGGGCWRAGVRGRPSATPWTADRMKLSGLHVSSPRKQMAHRFAREILVGHHLRLIAEELPAVKPAIFDRWPSLQDPIWAP